MIYINCPSYASLFFALHLKNKDEEVIVITINGSVKKYTEIVNIECIYLKNINFGIKKIYKIFEFKKQIDNIISTIEIRERDSFYLLDNSFTIEGFYLAKKWSKNCTVYFNNLEETSYKKYPHQFYKIKYVESFILKYIIKFYLGLELILLNVNSNPTYGISDKFLVKNKICSLHSQNSLTELKMESIRNNYIRLEQYDNLIVDQGLLSEVIRPNSIKNLFNQLISYNFNYVIKEHPTFKNSEIFERFPKYPDYIPAELLLGNVKKNVISVFSSTLILASKFKSINSISLLELIEWENEDYKLDVKNWLIKESDNKIIFVKSMDELIQYL